MPSLYVVATPIGNLEDVTVRALQVLRTVRLIAAEDTRKTRKLLAAYDIKTPLTAYHEHNKWAKLDEVLTFLENEGDIALVSEAGTPGISDPGYELIVAASQRNISIIPIPGPSVVTTAVAVSGLSPRRFTYLGFLPRMVRDRKKVLISVAGDPGTLVILEAPHRLRGALTDLLDILGDRRLTVCRELTKVHEEIFRGSLSQAVSHFTEPRGEFTLVVEGKPETPAAPPDENNVTQHLQQLRGEGKSAREAIAVVSQETGMNRRELYQLWLKLAKSV
jgi:16S rRNA (cytidine1402-2'-O)-methyltransferase